MSEAIRDTLLTLFKAKDRRPMYEWAHDYVELPAIIGRTGRFDITDSRHFQEPMDALRDDHVREVIIYKPTGTGGTLISDIWHCDTRSNDPGPMMQILQSDKVAEDHFRDRLRRMFEHCPTVRTLIPDERFALQKAEVQFSDGLPFYISGPGINNLQTKRIRYIGLDESWLYKPGTIAEAEGRFGNYKRDRISKLLITSQAGVSRDDTDLKWTSGTQKEWMVLCQGCQRHIKPVWTAYRADGTAYGMKWDTHKDERGFWQVEQCLNSVHFECECGHPHIHSARLISEWNRTGQYQSFNPGASRSVQSFRWSGIIWYPWRELVRQYLEALNAWKLGNSSMLVQFFQKVMAEPKSENDLIEDAIAFKRLEYDTQGKPPDEYMRVMTVDRQEEDVFWVLICSWTQDGQCRRLYFGKVFSFTEVKAKQDEYKVPNVFVDSGFQPKGDRGVYMACIKHGWVAIKGSNQDEFLHTLKNGKRVRHSYSEKSYGDPESGLNRGPGKQAPLFLFSSNVMSDRLQGLIQKGHWIEPQRETKDPMDNEFQRQVNAERKKLKIDKTTGREKFMWVQTRRDNHGRDCAKMQIFAATGAGILPDALEEPEEIQESLT